MPIQRSLARFGLAAIVFSTTFCALNVQAQSKSTSTPAAPVDKTIEVSPSKDWVDTGIDLHVGDTVTIAASTTGTGDNLCDPQGLATSSNSTKLPLASALPGSLIGKLQKNASPIFVGANRQLKIAEAGHLYLGSNLSGPSNCAGEFSAQVRVTPTTNDAVSMKSKLASAAQIWLSGQLGSSNEQPNPNASAVSNPGSGSAVNTSAPGTAPLKALAVSKVPLDTSLGKQLETLPRRVSDEFKNPGDMANFVLIGSEKQVQDALTAANWHVADTSTPGAVARAILMATQKQDYLQMPMSQLYMFGRVQDFGYEMAEPYAMVASRHHFRIWKAPFTYQGKEVWVGAGTHDIGFEKDQRNGKITHKIDPTVDGERDNIGDSLQQAGQVRVMSYFTPASPVLESRNATGGGFHSDGRLLVIFLQ